MAPAHVPVAWKGFWCFYLPPTTLWAVCGDFYVPPTLVSLAWPKDYYYDSDSNHSWMFLCDNTSTSQMMCREVCFSMPAVVDVVTSDFLGALKYCSGLDLVGTVLTFEVYHSGSFMIVGLWRLWVKSPVLPIITIFTQHTGESTDWLQQQTCLWRVVCCENTAITIIQVLLYCHDYYVIFF